MLQPNLRCERTRQQAISDGLPEQQINPTNCPFLAARLAFERNVVAKISFLAIGSLKNTIRSLRTPSIDPIYAWAITFLNDKYWQAYVPDQSTFESNEVFIPRRDSAIQCSSFFKWRYNNEILARKSQKPLTLATWFLTQPTEFIIQPHHHLLVLEVLRSATEKQIEEMASSYPNLLLPEAIGECEIFAKFALAYQSFDQLNKSKVVDIAFMSVDGFSQLEFFNQRMRGLSAQILTTFLNTHAPFAKGYFLGQTADNLAPELLRCYLNTPVLAFLEIDLALPNARPFDNTKKQLAVSRVSLHTKHFRTAFLETDAKALSSYIRIFANGVTAELLLALIKKDVDNITECLMQNYALYEALFFGDSNIVPQLDFAQPHLASRFVQYIPVKSGLVLSDVQLGALAKRTDVSTLSWLSQYFPTNPPTLTRLILQERPLLEHVLANPIDQIVSSLINDFPFTEVRPVTLLTTAMDTLKKCYPLTKEQLTKMLRLCDDVITDWLFQNETNFLSMREIREDAVLCASLRETNPRFLAHTIAEQNTSYETFFDLVLANPSFVTRMTQNQPVALQCYTLVAKKHLEHHVNADPIHTTLRTSSIASAALSESRSASSTNIEPGSDVKIKIATLSKQKKDFDKLVGETPKTPGSDRLASLYVLYTHESVADRDLNQKPAKITLAELLIKGCFDSPTKQYELLTMVLSDRTPVNKTTRKIIGSNIITPIDYLPTVQQCFFTRLETLEITQLLDLLAHPYLCNTVFKFYSDEIKALLNRRAEQDNSFTLLALCTPEKRAIFDRHVNKLESTQPLLTPEEQRTLLTHICNRTNDACEILATNLTLFSWCYSKHPERIKNIIDRGLDARVISLDVVLRSPELTQIFTAEELLTRMTPAQAKASVHYRHVHQLFNDENKLNRLLQKANLSAGELLTKLFKLETGNYHYLYARALLRRLNGETDVALPKPPAPAAVLSSLGSSSSVIRPMSVASTPERASAKSAADAASIQISSPLSASARSGSDIRSSVLVRADSLNVAAAPATPERFTVSAPTVASPKSSPESVLPAAFSLPPMPVTAPAVLPLSAATSANASNEAAPLPPSSSATDSAAREKEIKQLNNDSSAAASSTSSDAASSDSMPPSSASVISAALLPPTSAAAPETNAALTAQAAPPPPPRASADTSAASPVVLDANDTNTSAQPAAPRVPTPPQRTSTDISAAAAVASASPPPATDSASASSASPPPSAPTSTTAPKGPPPPPQFKKPAAAAAASLLPPGAAESSTRSNLLADIANLNSARRVKVAAKPAANGLGLFDGSAAAATAASSTSTESPTAIASPIPASLVALLNTAVSQDNRGQIPIQVAPKLETLRNPLEETEYEDKLRELVTLLEGLSLSGLASALAVGIGSRRGAHRASTYDESPSDFDENEASNSATSTPIIKATSSNPKVAAVLTEIRQLYPHHSPAQQSTPSM